MLSWTLFWKSWSLRYLQRRLAAAASAAASATTAAAANAAIAAAATASAAAAAGVQHPEGESEKGCRRESWTGDEGAVTESLEMCCQLKLHWKEWQREERKSLTYYLNAVFAQTRTCYRTRFFDRRTCSLLLNI